MNRHERRTARSKRSFGKRSARVRVANLHRRKEMILRVHGAEALSDFLISRPRRTEKPKAWPRQPDGGPVA